MLICFAPVELYQLDTTTALSILSINQSERGAGWLQDYSNNLAK